MKILVTGGAGYIGAHVVRALANHGYDPIILDDLRNSNVQRCGLFPLERIALENTDEVLRVFERHRPVGVVHLGGSISVGESVQQPDRYWENNLGAGCSLLLACAAYPVQTFLFSSTAAVYGNAKESPISENAALAPSSPYGSSKLAFERVLHQAGRALHFRSIALRYFNASGANVSWDVGEMHCPEEHLIPRVIRSLMQGQSVKVYGNDYPTTDGTCIRDYIHVMDLAEAHVEALDSTSLGSGQSLNVGTGRGSSVLEVIQAIAENLSLAPTIEFLPRRAGDPARLVADPSKLKACLKWVPIHSTIQEIVDSAISWEMSLEQAEIG